MYHFTYFSSDILFSFFFISMCHFMHENFIDMVFARKNKSMIVMISIELLPRKYKCKFTMKKFKSILTLINQAWLFLFKNFQFHFVSFHSILFRNSRGKKTNFLQQQHRTKKSWIPEITFTGLKVFCSVCKHHHQIYASFHLIHI
jgi:hypothetical protein